MEMGELQGTLQLRTVPAPLGNIGGPGLMVSKAFLEFILSNDSCL